MIIKVGNQSFDSHQVPVAILLTESERNIMLSPQSKPDGQLHVFAYWPGDINPNILMGWLSEAAPEIDLSKLRPAMFVMKQPVAPTQVHGGSSEVEEEAKKEV
jgi:hypothetical protein